MSSIYEGDYEKLKLDVNAEEQSLMRDIPLLDGLHHFWILGEKELISLTYSSFRKFLVFKDSQVSLAKGLTNKAQDIFGVKGKLRLDGKLEN